MSGAPSALRGMHRQGVRNRNDILLLSVVYSLSYEGEGAFFPFSLFTLDSSNSIEYRSGTVLVLQIVSEQKPRAAWKLSRCFRMDTRQFEICLESNSSGAE